MTRWVSTACAVVALLLFAPIAALAQATGQINGVVTDASGAVLVASVTAAVVGAIVFGQKVMQLVRVTG